jgi:hypothetical protein
MKRLLFLIVFVWVAIAGCHAQEMIQPVELAEKIFGKTKFKELNKYCTGEYKGRPNGKDFHKDVSTKFLLLQQLDTTAVVSMTITGKKGVGIDAYLFFRKEDKVWKLGAFRGLAMTGMIEQIVDYMQSLNDAQIDTLIAKGREDTTGREGMFKSRADFDFELGNSKLTIALDDDIIAHFNHHKEEFDRLKNIALEKLRRAKQAGSEAPDMSSDMKPDLQKIFISTVHTGEYGCDECVDFLIGGILDNTVGYLYIKDKKDVPAMSPERFIMIREIGDGWYLYKTT